MGARTTAAGVGGRLLSVATAGLAAVRPARKPLHPDGTLLEAVLEVAGGPERTGVELVDRPGSHAAVVRTSRAVGLPAPLPDIHGLAVRVLEAGAGPADLLLASTGSGWPSRFVLTASVRPDRWPLTTLLPYRSPTGPLLVAARADAEDHYTLSWARPRGPWQPWGELRLLGTDHADPEVSFDPVEHRAPGLEQYPAVVRLREPAYGRARRSRGSDT